MQVSKINLFENLIKNKKTAMAAAVTVPALLGATVLKPQPIKDTVEIFSTEKVAREAFINDFVKGYDKNIDETIKTHDFTKYGKKGLPLKYSRETMVNDIANITSNLHYKQKDLLLSKYNLAQNADLDGIAKIPAENPKTNEDKALRLFIKQYYNNETTIGDDATKKSMDIIIKGMPEFAMTIGKVQHGTHIYSVDIHTLEVLQKSLNHTDYETLSDAGKQVLKLAVLMHDFGKKGKVVTPGHAKQSKLDAEMILKNYDIDQNIKDRVLNHIENHHWFENFNTGRTNANDVKRLFNNKEDLTIAKIMAKSDLEGISPTFHRQILHYGKFLTQEEFDKEFSKKMNQIN